MVIVLHRVLKDIKDTMDGKEVRVGVDIKDIVDIKGIRVIRDYKVQRDVLGVKKVVMVLLVEHLVPLRLLGIQVLRLLKKLRLVGR